MRNNYLYILFLFFLVPFSNCFAIDETEAKPFAGQDLHLAGKEVLSSQVSPAEHLLVFDNGFSMSIAANRLSSDKAVVWLQTKQTEYRGRIRIDYQTTVYLEGNVSRQKAKGSMGGDLKWDAAEEGLWQIVTFTVTGEVFVTADERRAGDPATSEIYKRASAVRLPLGPRFFVQPGAKVPEWPIEEPPIKHEPVKKTKKPRKLIPSKPPVTTEDKKPTFVYPVNISPAGEMPLDIERSETADGTAIATVTSRFYVWQKQDEAGGLLELQADNAVIFYAGNGSDKKETDSIDSGAISAIYMCGDVLMMDGPRTIDADEMYYDFHRKKALALNAVMKNFDVKRGIPIYIRAARLRKVSENSFAADNVTVTSSEFYKPQISTTVSSIFITDLTATDKPPTEVSDSSYDAQMTDVRMKVGKKTIFRWPYMRSNLQRPDVPIKSVRVGNDSSFGTSLETRWFLSRLLGLRQPEGVESTFSADYFSKRGVGAGADIDYNKETWFGNISTYIIKDRGKDRLGRDDTRKGLESGNDLRGRFGWQHRQFLPYNWQFTSAINYISDENFIESFYRKEFNTYDHETYVHMKRIEDNWGLSFLANARLNDFSDQLEELPTTEFHLTGQSLFDDRFTLYSDTQISRLRQRIGDDHTTAIDEDMFSFAWHRTELDMPMRMKGWNLVPFAAATVAYDDRSGFTRTLVDGSNTGNFGDDQVWIGEMGIRLSPNPIWKVYPNVKSEMWDLDQLRHIIAPHMTAVAYEQSDSVVRQRDTLNMGISQRLQTKRPAGDDKRTVDWMRLDTDITWVKDSVHPDTAAADRFIWAKPFVPMRVFSAPDIFNGDLDSTRSLPTFEMFGPSRNHFTADYIWRISDTAAILGDMNFDIQSGVVQQLNIGLSRLVWPDLQFFVGSRYLRRLNVLEEKGSNTFTFAATYILDPRYTMVFAQQFDFDYGTNNRSDITLLRKYHRICYGLTFSADASLDRKAVVFSIWPQGIKELAIGQRRYMGIGQTDY